jgi:GH25 family lysozyme M1 (1,4-beta-N-acetylmuramidase)
MEKIIDVSKHNGSIDWKKVKADKQGITGVIIRAGYGRHISQKDQLFEENYKGAKEAGLNVGAYWYSYAQNELEAMQEAAACAEVIQDKQFELPVYFDIEDKCQQTLGMGGCTAIVHAFCGALEKSGYFVGLYSYDSFYNTHLDKSLQGRYSCWVARVGTKPKYCVSYDAWQNSWSGKVDGIPGAVDEDEFYKDFPAIIKHAHLNGY